MAEGWALGPSTAGRGVLGAGAERPDRDGAPGRSRSTPARFEPTSGDVNAEVASEPGQAVVVALADGPESPASGRTQAGRARAGLFMEDAYVVVDVDPAAAPGATRFLADAVVDPVVSARMSRVRSRDTRPEVALRSELHRRGLRFRIGRRPIPALRRTADVVFGPARVAVLVDGCFWHKCPNHYRPSARNEVFWAEKIADNQRRDHETNRLFAEAGWRVIRVWEHEDPAEAADRIFEIVTCRRH